MVWGQEDFPGDEALIAKFLAQISGRSVEGRIMKTGVVAAVACLCAACAALDVPFEIRLPKEAEPHEDWASRKLGSYLARRVIGSLTVEGLAKQVQILPFPRKNKTKHVYSADPGRLVASCPVRKELCFVC